MRTGWRAVTSLAVIAATLAAAASVGWVSDRLGVDDAFTIDRFDRRVLVEPNGATYVEETIDVTFAQSRRGIFRDLPHETRFAGGSYEILSVDRGTDDAAWSYSIESQHTGIRVRIGDANTWLPPGTYRYRLRFVAPTWSHVLTDDPTVVETRIDVPGFDWPTSAHEVILRVWLPGPTLNVDCVEGRPGSTRTCSAEARFADNEVTLDLGPYPHRQSATVSLHTSADAFTAPLPSFDPVPLGAFSPRQLFALDPIPAALAVALLVLMPLAGLDVAYARTVYRDRVTDPALHDRAHPVAIPAPPIGLRPPETAGLLLRRQPSSLLLAQLVDLEQRQVITTATSAHGSATALTVERGPRLEQADDTDKAFVDLLIPAGGATRFSGTYDQSVARRASTASQLLVKRATGVFRKQGLEHDGGPLLRSAAFKVTATLAMLAWVAMVALPMAAYSPLPPAGVVIIAVTALVGWGLAHSPWAHHRLPLNSHGRDVVAQARSFREFIATVEGDQIEWAAGQPGIGHTHPALALLPYAIALGLAESWYERFSGVLTSLAAAGAAGAAGGAAWWTTSSGFSNVSTTQTASTTAPSSSGGGGGGGGGSGGGGGGGGSW